MRNPSPWTRKNVCYKDLPSDLANRGSFPTLSEQQKRWKYNEQQ